MAYGGVPNHTDMTDVSAAEQGGATTSVHDAAGASLAQELVQQLGQVSLESSSSSCLAESARSPRFTPDKYALRDLEIQQTIGELDGVLNACLS